MRPADITQSDIRKELEAMADRALKVGAPFVLVKFVEGVPLNVEVTGDGCISHFHRALIVIACAMANSNGALPSDYLARALDDAIKIEENK